MRDEQYEEMLEKQGAFSEGNVLQLIWKLLGKLWRKIFSRKK